MQSSDSNVSAKATPKSLQEVISEDISAGLSIEDFENESQSARASEVIREERPDSPQRNHTKLSPRSEYDNSYDPYDEELSAGAFIGSSSYYCKVCQKNLNGIACYETHMNGKKHKKAGKAYKHRSEVSSLDNVAGNHVKEPLVSRKKNMKWFELMLDRFDRAWGPIWKKPVPR